MGPVLLLLIATAVSVAHEPVHNNIQSKMAANLLAAAAAATFSFVVPPLVLQLVQQTLLIELQHRQVHGTSSKPQDRGGERAHQGSTSKKQKNKAEIKSSP